MPTKMDIYKEEQKKRKVWQSIVDDLSIGDREATIAKFLMDSGVDITNPKDLELLRIKNPETGEFEPLDIPLWETMDKETALGCVYSILETIENGGIIYNFNSLKYREKDNIEVLKFSPKEGFTWTDMEMDTNVKLQAPKEVPKPGAFKRLANRMFGYFGKEIDAYDRYVVQKKDYEKKAAERSRKRDFLEDYANELTKGRERAKIESEIRDEIVNGMSVEEKLRLASERETKTYDFKEAVTGRNTKLLGRHKNYRELKNKPLTKYKKLPMEGLALLAGCSVEANKGIADASSQPEIHLSGETVPTEAETKLFDEMTGYMNKVNIAAKVMQSCYGGKDIKRMGDRTEALLNGRKKLNDAVEAHKQGNKEPLAALIKDSFPVVYATIKSMTGTLSTPQGEAVAEIADAMTFLFETDPELIRMAGVTEKEIQDMKGIAKICRELQHGDKKIYEDFLNDKGPDTPERKEAVEDRIFRAVLVQRVTAENAAEQQRIGDIGGREMAKPENMEILMRYSGKDQADITNGFNIMINEKNERAPRVFAEMGSDDFDMNAYREEVLEEARKTPEYQQLMSMDREQLANTSFEDIGTKVADSMAKKPKKAFPGLEASAQRSMDRAKQVPEPEQPNLDLPDLEWF